MRTLTKAGFRTPRTGVVIYRQQNLAHLYFGIYRAEAPPESVKMGPCWRVAKATRWVECLLPLYPLCTTIPHPFHLQATQNERRCSIVEHNGVLIPNHALRVPGTQLSLCCLHECIPVVYLALRSPLLHVGYICPDVSGLQRAVLRIRATPPRSFPTSAHPSGAGGVEGGRTGWVWNHFWADEEKTLHKGSLGFLGERVGGWVAGSPF